MPRFSCEIALDNAAFDDPAELPRILRVLADRIEDETVEPRDDADGRLLDVNGNGVGRWTIDAAPTPPIWERFSGGWFRSVDGEFEIRRNEAGPGWWLIGPTDDLLCHTLSAAKLAAATMTAVR